MYNDCVHLRVWTKQFPPPSFSMRTAWSLGASAVLLSQSVFVHGALAATFPDVSTSNAFSVAISALAEKQIIKGNADGTFAPDRTVNRAEFLTLLYRAKALAPATPMSSCFKDVPSNAWFAAVVCDAAKNGFVAGYSDKTFKPEQAVNKVEALKMMFTVLGLSQQSTPESMTQSLAYSDLSASAWYMQYVSAAFRLRILPVPGMSATLLTPDKPLSRSEAAGFIYNAIYPSPLPLDGSSVSSAMMQNSSATTSTYTGTRSSSAKSLVSEAVGTITAVDFPFNDNGIFTKKLTQSYRFTLKEKTTATFQINLIAQNTQDDVTCRLFKVDGADSFALEYYLGNQGTDTCTIIATLSPGAYQFDVAPRVMNANYTLSAKKVKGDGNDGFIEAKALILNNPSSSFIETNDLGDFYTFTLKEQTNMMVELTNAENLKCVIYPMADVDIYGFSGPNCNAQYDFPAGTYYVGVLQKDDRNTKQSYSVRYTK